MAQLLRPLFRGTLPQQALRRWISTTFAHGRPEKGVNKVQLLGRVGAVPKDFTSSSGKRLVAFPLATTHTFKAKNPDGTESLTSRSTWHSINVFRSYLQDLTVMYVQKGSRVYISGRLQNVKVTQDDGTDKYITSVIADELIHIQSPRSSSSESGEFSSTGDLGSYQEEEGMVDMMPEEEREGESTGHQN